MNGTGKEHDDVEVDGGGIVGEHVAIIIRDRREDVLERRRDLLSKLLDLCFTHAISNKSKEVIISIEKSIQLKKERAKKVEKGERK